MSVGSPKSSLTERLLPHDGAKTLSPTAMAKAPDEVPAGAAPVKNLIGQVPQVKPKSVFSYAYPVVKIMARMTDASEGLIAGVESQMILTYMLGLSISPILISPTLAFLIPFNMIWIVLTIVYLMESYKTSLKLADIEPDRKATATLETISTTVQPEETQAQTYKTIEDFYKSPTYEAIVSLSRTRVDISLDKYKRKSWFMRCALPTAHALSWVEAGSRGVFTIAGIDTAVLNTGNIGLHTLKNQGLAVAGGGVFKLVKHGAERTVAKATPSITIVSEHKDLDIPKWEKHEKARLALTFILAVTRHSCPSVWWSRIALEIINFLTGSEPIPAHLKFYTLLASGLATSAIFSFPVVVQAMVTRTKRKATLEEIRILEGKYPASNSWKFWEIINFKSALTYWKITKEVLFPTFLTIKGTYDFTDNLNQKKEIENLPLSPTVLWILLVVFLIANFTEFIVTRNIAYEQEQLDRRITNHYWQKTIRSSEHSGKPPEADESALAAVTGTAYAAVDIAPADVDAASNEAASASGPGATGAAKASDAGTMPLLAALTEGKAADEATAEP